jgi:hypothetical protein
MIPIVFRVRWLGTRDVFRLSSAELITWTQEWTHTQALAEPHGIQALKGPSGYVRRFVT